MDTRKAAVEIRSIVIYPDSSGAPALLVCGPYAFAMDYIAGEIKITLINPVSGSRRQNEIAAERARRTYIAMIDSQTDVSWRAANVALYAD